MSGLLVLASEWNLLASYYVLSDCTAAVSSCSDPDLQFYRLQDPESVFCAMINNNNNKTTTRAIIIIIIMIIMISKFYH